MGEHQSKMEIMIQNTFKMDVTHSLSCTDGIHSNRSCSGFLGEDMSLYTVWAILIGVGIIKAYFIAAWFMHLQTDPRTYFGHPCSRSSSLH